MTLRFRLEQGPALQSLNLLAPFRDLLDRRGDPQQVQRLSYSVLVRDPRIFVYRVLPVRDAQAPAVLRSLTVEHSEMQILPARYHVDDAGELEHKQRRRVKRILIARLEEIDRPHVDVLQVRVPRKRTHVVAVSATP